MEDNFVYCIDCKSDNCIHCQIEKYQSEFPIKVIESVTKSFPNDYKKILANKLKWDGMNGCYYFSYAGMYVGVEEDGYIHT